MLRSFSSLSCAASADLSYPACAYLNNNAMHRDSMSHSKKTSAPLLATVQCYETAAVQQWLQGVTSLRIDNLYIQQHQELTGCSHTASHLVQRGSVEPVFACMSLNISLRPLAVHCRWHATWQLHSCCCSHCWQSMVLCKVLRFKLKPARWSPVRELCYLAASTTFQSACVANACSAYHLKPYARTPS